MVVVVVVVVAAEAAAVAVVVCPVGFVRQVPCTWHSCAKAGRELEVTSCVL